MKISMKRTRKRWVVYAERAGRCTFNTKEEAALWMAKLRVARARGILLARLMGS